VWIGFLTLLIWSLSAPRGTALAGEVAGLDYFKQAKINWRAYEGQRISLGLLKHLYTESLVPLLLQFEALTGMKVDYLILPELEYNAKLATDLSNQRGEFNVVMSGPMRNWAFVTGDWIVPLDPFLNDPKLTDRAWYKLEDFYPGLIAANRWDGTIGGGTGEGSLWTIPAMVESYILAYRKDILDRYKIKVPTSYEELAEAARLVKKHAGIDGIDARGNPRGPHPWGG
jgi:multiple sugar transport system substrate-binding protein